MKKQKTLYFVHSTDPPDIHEYDFGRLGYTSFNGKFFYVEGGFARFSAVVNDRYEFLNEYKIHDELGKEYTIDEFFQFLADKTMIYQT